MIYVFSDDDGFYGLVPQDVIDDMSEKTRIWHTEMAELVRVIFLFIVIKWRVFLTFFLSLYDKFYVILHEECVI